MTDFETHPAGTAARIAELEAALDSIETSHGLTSNGNLWRFWSKKGQEVAADNTKLRQNLEHWRQEVGKLHSQVATLTDQLTRANAATAAAYEVAARAIMEKCHDDMDRKEEAAIVRALATPDQTAALDKLIAEAVGPYVDALKKIADPETEFRGHIARTILAASKKGGAA